MPPKITGLLLSNWFTEELYFYPYTCVWDYARNMCYFNNLKSYLKNNWCQREWETICAIIYIFIFWSATSCFMTTRPRRIASNHSGIWSNIWPPTCPVLEFRASCISLSVSFLTEGKNSLGPPTQWTWRLTPWSQHTCQPNHISKPPSV